MRWLTSSPVTIFLRSNQHMRNDYLTYFEWYNCSSELAEFNAFKIIKKYWDLTQKSGLTRFKALVDRSLACIIFLRPNQHMRIEYSNFRSSFLSNFLHASKCISIERITHVKQCFEHMKSQLDWMLSTSEERIWKMIEEVIISSSSLRRCHQLRNSQARNREINRQFPFCFYSSFLEFFAETRFCLTHSLHRLSRLERVLDISERLSEQNLALEIVRDC